LAVALSPCRPVTDDGRVIDEGPARSDDASALPIAEFRMQQQRFLGVFEQAWLPVSR
jgi:hypothetical protein